ncbi:MAG: glycosyltransferase family 2 protein [Bdellovibrionales bacterium]|nr:glycosyltransferase family 2 protein [Bdellovibrionales bacterium]
MFFSVVVPTHKRKHLLLKLLQSLQKQHLPPDEFEVIVIATAKDEAFDLLLEFQPNFCWQIQAIPNDPFSGRSAAAKRNYGVQLASAPWIAFVDDDCITSPEWLETAKKTITKEQPHMVEGQVVIPTPKKKTLTYKGLLRLSQAGGYQTCNMFYKKSDFVQIGGFDLNFPFYLEDTDLAWSFLEKNKKSVYAVGAIVEHPVPPPDPSRMLQSAFRMEKLSYLYKKHPQLYRGSKMRALPRVYFLMSLFDLGILTTLLNLKLSWLAILIGLRLLLTLLYSRRLFKNCEVAPAEYLATFYYLMICPLISVFQLLKGNITHRVWLFLR